MISSSFGRRLGAFGLALATLGIASCSSDSGAASSNLSQTVTLIGTKDTEGTLLLDIYARALEGAGFRVARRASVDTFEQQYAAVESGAADVFVTHTGEFLDFLTEKYPEAAAATTTTVAATTTTVEATTTTAEPTTTTAAATTTTGDDTDSTSDSTEDSASDSTPETTVAETTTTISTAGQASAIAINVQTNQIGELLPDTIQVSAAAAAEDKPVIACNSQTATGMSLLSDLAKVSDTLRIAGTAEFETSDGFGIPGFEQVYGAGFGEFIDAADSAAIAEAFAPAVEEDTTDTSTADTATDSTSTDDTDAVTTTTEAPVIETDADCGAFASSLDPAITTGMVVLDDDLNWLPTNAVVPITSAAAYTPGVQQVLIQVSQALTTTDLRDMIRFVDEEDVLPGTMAGQWLSAYGIGG